MTWYSLASPRWLRQDIKNSLGHKRHQMPHPVCWQYGFPCADFGRKKYDRATTATRCFCAKNGCLYKLSEYSWCHRHGRNRFIHTRGGPASGYQGVYGPGGTDLLLFPRLLEYFTNLHNIVVADVFIPSGILSSAVAISLQLWQIIQYWIKNVWLEILEMSPIPIYSQYNHIQSSGENTFITVTYFVSISRCT